MGQIGAVGVCVLGGLVCMFMAVPDARVHWGSVRGAEGAHRKAQRQHLMPDHVHVLISIPPKYAVAHVVGSIKGKSAILVARTFGERKRNFVGQHLWARGYFVSTVGVTKQ